jgi:hypothetical protein
MSRNRTFGSTSTSSIELGNSCDRSLSIRDDEEEALERKSSRAIFSSSDSSKGAAPMVMGTICLCLCFFYVRSNVSMVTNDDGNDRSFGLGSSRRRDSIHDDHNKRNNHNSGADLGEFDGGPDGALICAEDLKIIEEELAKNNDEDPIVRAIKNDVPNLAAFPSIDPDWQRRNGNEWYHKPAFSGRPEDGYVMCVPGEWDDTYTYNFDSMFTEGMCIKEIRTDIKGGDFSGCDVRVFSQFAYIFKNDWKQGNLTARAEDNVFYPPPKLSENVVDFYYAHESPDHYGYELKGTNHYSRNSLGNMQYLAWFNGDPKSNLQSSVWYPFGSSVGSLMRDYQFQRLKREERIPVVAWMSKDCVMRERINVLVEVSKHFPVFSMGRCEQNVAPSQEDPGREGSFADQQEIKSRYMFYFALENGIQCPHYMTEKIYDALSRGSIPIYIGWDGFEDYIPDKEAVIDLRDYKSIDELAAKLAFVATNDDAYNKMHAWRAKSPSEWPLKYRNLVRQVSSDLKFGLCSTLKEGPENHPPVDAYKQPVDVCNHDVSIMGRPVSSYQGRVAEWWETAGWKAESAGAVAQVEVVSPFQFLDQQCDRTHHPECWKLKMPGLVEYAETLYAHVDEEDKVKEKSRGFVDIIEDVVDKVEDEVVDAFDGGKDNEDDDLDDVEVIVDEEEKDTTMDLSSSSTTTAQQQEKEEEEEEEEEQEVEQQRQQQQQRRENAKNSKSKKHAAAAAAAEAAADDERRTTTTITEEDVERTLENPATTPADLILLRKELELLEKENALLLVKEKAAALGFDGLSSSP